MFNCKIIAVILAVLCVTTVSQSANVTFDGGDPDDSKPWTKPDNWDTGVIPGTLDSVFFDPSKFAVVDTEVPDISNLYVDNSSVLNITSWGLSLDRPSFFADLNVYYHAGTGYNGPGTGTSMQEGAILMSSGTFSCETLSVGWAGVGMLYFEGGEINCDTNMYVGYHPQARGTVFMSGGTMNIGGQLWINHNTNGCVFNVDEGILNVASDIYLGYNADKTGELNVSGGQVNANALIVGYDGIGKVSLTGGVMNISALAFGFGLGDTGYGSIDITEGIINYFGGDITATVDIWEIGGQLLAYGGTGDVLAVYDPCDNTTTVWAYPSAAYDPNNTMDMDMDGDVDIEDLRDFSGDWLK